VRYLSPDAGNRWCLSVRRDLLNRTAGRPPSQILRFFPLLHLDTRPAAACPRWLSALGVTQEPPAGHDVRQFSTNGAKAAVHGLGWRCTPTFSTPSPIWPWTRSWVGVTQTTQSIGNYYLVSLPERSRLNRGPAKSFMNMAGRARRVKFF